MGIDRGAFVRIGASAAAAGVLSGAVARADYGDLVFQLPWIKNVEWAGEYFADRRGYYRDAGFSNVTLLSSGPTSPPVEVLVASGRAFASISSLANTASAILAGASVKTIGVQYQTSPYIIASPAARPLRTPRDMIGKRIGVPASNEVTWRAFLGVNAIDPAAVNVVTVGATPAPLANDQVDGLLAFLTNVPHALKAQGFGVHWFGLGDFGYPLVNNNYIVAEDTLRTRRDAVKALLRAEIRGWKASIAAPAASAKIAVEDYGRDLSLDPAAELSQSAVQASLMQSPQTRAGGLFTLSPAMMKRSVALLHASGIAIAPEQLFDLSPLHEVYAEDPSLR